MTKARARKPLTPRQLLLRAIVRGVLSVLALLVVAHVSACVIHSIVHPLATLHRVTAEQRAWERKVAEKKRQLVAMKAQKTWWSSPAGEDELAHKLGLVKPGENTVIVMPPPPPAAKAQALPVPPAAPEISPTFRVAALGVFVCLLVYGALLWRRRRLLAIRQAVGVLTPRKELVRR